MVSDLRKVNPKTMFDEVVGALDPRVYVDERLYQLELERVFGRSWLFVAHESQVPKAGDYVTSYMAEDSVVVARQPDGTIAVFLNACRHRGMKLCRSDGGNSKTFTCSYHGWTYDTGGRLVAIPMEEMLYRNPVDKSLWSARRVPRVHSYKGFVFATWSSDAPSFEEYIADIAPYIDAIFDGGVDGVEVIGGVEKYRLRANWKLAADQYVSDDSHFPFTHASGFAASMGANPEMAARSRPPTPNEARHVRSRYGHGIGFSTDAGWHETRQALNLGPEISAYLIGEHREASVRRHGEVFGKDFGLTHGCVFPNFGVVGLGMFRVFHPRGPDGMEIWVYAMVPKHAPEALKQRWRIEVMHTFGAGGIFEQEDGNAWSEIQRTLRGTRAQQNLLNVQLGAGQEKDPSGRFPGTTDASVTEEGTRAFYRRWTELMCDERNT